MLVHRFIGQPKSGNGSNRNIDGLLELINTSKVQQLDAAVAYVTNSGVDLLFEELEAAGAAEKWRSLDKRFLVSFDWVRSHPTALDRLISTENSAVRVHDGERVVTREGCTPHVPWHPKWFAVRGHDTTGSLSGSGNLSRNGLSSGHEAGNLQIVSRPTSSAERAVLSSLTTSHAWFERCWLAATPYEQVKSQYLERYRESGNTPFGRTDDESDSTGRDGSARGLTAEQLSALTSASNFWIQAGKVTKNRGKLLPGNQLMMSAQMRVFFGASVETVDRNTTVARPVLRHPTSPEVYHEAPVRFSDNSMDVITLPVPKAPWTHEYDDHTLLFTKRVNGSDLEFVFTVGTEVEAEHWRASSTQQSSSWSMRSGREWGVFA